MYIVLPSFKYACEGAVYKHACTTYSHMSTHLANKAPQNNKNKETRAEVFPSFDLVKVFSPDPFPPVPQVAYLKASFSKCWWFLSGHLSCPNPAG